MLFLGKKKKKQKKPHFNKEGGFLHRGCVDSHDVALFFILQTSEMVSIK